MKPPPGYFDAGLMTGYTDNYQANVARAHQVLGTPAQATYPEVIFPAPHNFLITLIDGLFFDETLNCTRVFVRKARKEETDHG